MNLQIRSLEFKWRALTRLHCVPPPTPRCRALTRRFKCAQRTRFARLRPPRSVVSPPNHHWLTSPPHCTAFSPYEHPPRWLADPLLPTPHPVTPFCHGLFCPTVPAARASASRPDRSLKVSGCSASYAVVVSATRLPVMHWQNIRCSCPR